MLAAALKAQLCSMTLEQFVGLFANPYREIMEYALLLEGGDTCQRTSLLFNPHRLDIKTVKSKASVYAALKQVDSYASGLARAALFVSGGVAKTSVACEAMYTSIGIGVNGIQYVNEFPPAAMRDICLQHRLGPDSRVLDPCAGWGGRMIGASAVVNEYRAFEPSTRTHAGLLRLRDFIASFRPSFKAKISMEPFEEGCRALREGYYDLAMTSPPYYDTERYADGEKTQSCNKFKSFEKWVDGFYVPLIRGTMRALKPGAPFIINIGSRMYPLNDVLRQKFGAQLKITRAKGRLSGAEGSLGKKGEGETFYELRKK